MSLPAPSYAINVDLRFNGTLVDVIVIRSGPGSPATNRTVIEWEKLTEADQALFNTTVARYGGTLPFAIPVAGREVVTLSSLAGSPADATPTGYQSTGTGTLYANVQVDGINYNIGLQEKQITTYASLIAKLNSKLSGVATASLNGNRLVITSDNLGGVGSNVQITKGGDYNVFRRLAQFRRWNDPVPGANDASEMLEANQLNFPLIYSDLKEHIIQGKKYDLTTIATSDLPFIRFLDTVGDGSGVKAHNKNYGTGSPGVATIRFIPPPGTVAIVNALNVHYSDAGSFTFDGFGADASPLTNGIVIKATIDGILYDFTDGVPITENTDWQHISSNVLLNTWANPGDTLLAQLNISSFGRPLILIADRGDQLFVELSDDFSFLDDFHFVAHGFL